MPRNYRNTSRFTYNPEQSKINMTQCIAYLDKLTKTIKREYQLDHIDMYTYEQQINIITCLRLTLEEFRDNMYQFPALGGLVVNETV